MISNAFPAMCAAALFAVMFTGPPVHAYDNFKVSVYCRAYEVKQMGDPAWLEARWKELSSQVHVDKVYLETHRDLVIVDDKTIEVPKQFFQNRGCKPRGGSRSRSMRAINSKRFRIRTQNIVARCR